MICYSIEKRRIENYTGFLRLYAVHDSVYREISASSPVFAGLITLRLFHDSILSPQTIFLKDNESTEPQILAEKCIFKIYFSKNRIEQTIEASE